VSTGGRDKSEENDVGEGKEKRRRKGSKEGKEAGYP
jgi:hypothetical protein